MHPVAAEAAAAEAAGDLDTALALYVRLEAEAPDAPMWSKKVAGVHRQRGDLDQRIEALVRAADKHNRRGELMKGIATLKSAQNIAPKHPALAAAMERLRRARPSSPTAPPPIVPTPPPHLASDTEQPLAVIPLMRQARAASGIAPPIVEVQSVDLDPRRDPDPIALDILPPIPLFSSLDASAFGELLDKSTSRPIADGATIFTKGSRGDALFVVVDGAVDVFLEDDAPAVARLEEGAFFGEMSLFTGRPRNATVRAAGAGELLVFDHADIQALIVKSPPVLSSLLEFFRERLAANVLAHTLGAGELSEAARAELRACFTLLDVAEDHAIIEQGRPSPGLFVLVDGALVVDHVSAFGTTSNLATLEPGALVGEISTITEVPATATVITKTRALLLALGRDDVGAVAARHPALLDYARRLAAERLEALAGPLWT